MKEDKSLIITIFFIILAIIVTVIVSTVIIKSFEDISYNILYDKLEL